MYVELQIMNGIRIVYDFISLHDNIGNSDKVYDGNSTFGFLRNKIIGIEFQSNGILIIAMDFTLGHA